MEENYRDPDSILKQIEASEEQIGKGKLKIFFGYAAGIGKTYAMLEAAHAAKEASIDVVIGYIEPHARPETIDLVNGLDVIPTMEVKYNNIILKEFDLDAVLKRSPELVLVDELAHTNAKGCRHEKRYQDIKELLNVGIDVYTTVNVQHLESLNDVIAGITGIIVRERIPDSIFDEANQVEMIDLEPEELLMRLHQGKIYKDKQAKKAINHFFSLDNLISLREIALRRMADRVNIVQEKVTIGTKEAEGAAVEHILICLSPSPSNEKVIRQAARMANAFHGKFTAFYVETSDFAEMSKENRDRLKRNTILAEQLGAKVVSSYGSDIVEQIAEYAKASRVSKIVLGRTYTKRTLLSVRESFSERLTKLAPKLEIFIIPDAYNKKYVNKKKQKSNRQNIESFVPDTIASLCIIIAATLISYLFSYLGFSDANLIMVYLFSVLITSIATNRRIFSVIYSVASVFIFNFCFIEPKMTFTVNDPEYIATFIIMFIMALLSSSLTQKVKNHAKQTAKNAYRMEILLETSQKLQKTKDSPEIIQKTEEQLGKLLEKNIYIFLGNPEENRIPYSYKTNETRVHGIDKGELAVAVWTYKNNKHAGFSTTTLPGAKCLYLAVRNSDKVFAVVGIDMEDKEIPAFEKDIMSAILNECALALEKEELVMEQKESAVKLQQEQLRANLLRSISHDLRTPLTSISGNAGILIGNADKINQSKRHSLYVDIYDDSMWLINLVENLLSVTRIENGTMNLTLEPELLEDVITEALKHINRKSVEHKIVREEEELLVAKMDAKLMVQVIINLVDNAIKYTEKGSEIIIAAKRKKQHIIVEVADNGSNGITQEQKEKLFDMFYTVNNSVADGRRGMGLGLALCKSIVNAHGGQISILDNRPRGTIIRFTLKAEEVKLE
ncbi:sensor histidine kinase [Anaeromicropila herbilytica]|uniref:histidine kinase n=1 Tax=Anaeromicropila herbilytica TaxID=2785025 RepID=A0A7R7IAW6_9FIRM|nr:sensor histidine kinase KdpD [Anaeromicropila herbilytica]BCN28882.1 sensor protein KdpD [Anaeromicropila herbilytica]